MCRLSCNLGTSTSWNPLGLFRPVMGLLYLYLYQIVWYCEWITHTQTGSSAKCCPGVYQWGAGLAVSGRMGDIGQNVLQYSFQTESSSRPSHIHILFLTAFLDQISVWNIIQHLHYIIVTRINNNNNGIINNTFGRLQDLILLFKIPMATQKSLQIYRHFGHAPSKLFASPAVSKVVTATFVCRSSTQ